MNHGLIPSSGSSDPPTEEICPRRQVFASALNLPSSKLPTNNLLKLINNINKWHPNTPSPNASRSTSFKPLASTLRPLSAPSFDCCDPGNFPRHTSQHPQRHCLLCFGSEGAHQDEGRTSQCVNPSRIHRFTLGVPKSDGLLLHCERLLRGIRASRGRCRCAGENVR